MFEDTKEVIRRHKSMKDREHNGQKFEDTKGVIRRHKSMKDREHNVQKFKDNKTFGHCVLCPSSICVF
jgi:RNA polymerase-binding transcription factor DksA